MVDGGGFMVKVLFRAKNPGQDNGGVRPLKKQEARRG